MLHPLQDQELIPINLHQQMLMVPPIQTKLILKTTQLNKIMEDSLLMAQPTAEIRPKIRLKTQMTLLALRTFQGEESVIQ